MPKSKVITLLDLVWSNTNAAVGHSHERLNHAMRNALELAIGSGFEFAAADVKYIRSNYRSHFWIGETDEWIYTLAVKVGNMSAIKSFEKYKDREPFIAAKVEVGSNGDYLHLAGNRQKERLAVGFNFMFEGRKCTVTSFAKDQSFLTAYSYKKVKCQHSKYFTDKVDKRFKVTRVALLADRADRKERGEIDARLRGAGKANGTWNAIVKTLGVKTIEQYAEIPLGKLRKVAEKYAPLPPKIPRAKRQTTYITQEHIDACKAAGACNVPYNVGQPLSAVSNAHMKWARENIPDVLKALEASIAPAAASA